MKSFKSLLISTLLFCGAFTARGQAAQVWIDADTGNETDDVYAIVRALYSPTIHIAGLSSAHFNNSDLVAFKKWNQYDTRDINTVQISQKLNEMILQKTGRTDIVHPMGADRQMGRAWGGTQPGNSAAAQQIIAAVKQLHPNQKLTVICLGALTNIASAIALDTTIAPKLVCYLLGARYDTTKACWNKNEFNIRNDLNAFDYLLDNPAVNLVVMPITTAASFRFKRDALYAILNDNSPVEKMLKDRWIATNPDDQERTLWDLALVEAYLNPDLVTVKVVLTPPENTARKIKLIVDIKAEQMKKDFIATLKAQSNDKKILPIR